MKNLLYILLVLSPFFLASAELKATHQDKKHHRKHNHKNHKHGHSNKHTHTIAL